MFASLIILNQRWRLVSQNTQLYAHHLSQCPSYAAAHPHGLDLETLGDDDLPNIRRLFAQEIKRNLFEAYLRPKETIIRLVSTSTGASSAPGGEAFHFNVSPGGAFILAYSSSRIHVIDVRKRDAIVRGEFKISRRPTATTITDDGSVLAVLSADLQIDMYDLDSAKPKLTRTIPLDHMPRTIALSPNGSVIAAAYDAGVEVLSLDGNYQHLGRRAVKCYGVDRLSFSRDGTQLLGSTLQSRSPSTVILTAPYFDPGAAAPEEAVSALWTTSILFPNGSRDCSHAALLPASSSDDASWLFAYDRIFETFRAVRVDDLRNGTTYFTGPPSDSSNPLLPSTLPTASAAGDVVAAAFQGAIWLYGVPEDLEALPINNLPRGSPESGVSTPVSPLGRRNSAPSLRSVHRHRDSIVRTPQWQVLCDKFRNTFVQGRKISSLERCSAAGWVSDYGKSFEERLIAVAPGVQPQMDYEEDDGTKPVDGGRILILDFDYLPQDGGRESITIEVGTIEPQILEEEQRDLDAEVAIVRRRTVAQKRIDRTQVARSSTTSTRGLRHDFMPMPDIPDRNTFSSTRPIRRPSTQTTASGVSDVNSLEEMEAFDAPYAHGAPRSQTTLRRAATAAASNRRFRPTVSDQSEYRRADGREEHPHESDADNWVPPPPPYSKDIVPDLPPLPEHIQRSIMAEAALANLERNALRRSPILDFPGLDRSPLTRSRTVASTSSSGSRRERLQFHRTFSETTPTTPSVQNSERLSFEEEVLSVVSPGVTPFEQGEDQDDLYDVSPQRTPPLSPRRMSAPTSVLRLDSPEQLSGSRNVIPRRPVAIPQQSSETTTAVSPPLVMGATLQQPASPIPETTPEETPVLSINEIAIDRETSPPSPQADYFASCDDSVDTVQSSQLNVSKVDPKVDINKGVPPRPDSQHHLTELPPTTPIFTGPQPGLEAAPRRSETAPIVRTQPEIVDDEPIPLWQRTGTAPASSNPVANALNISGPTADQLARLSSRSGRPTSAADPRRRSGSSGRDGHRRGSSAGRSQDMFPWVIPDQNVVLPRMTAEQSFNQIQSQQQGNAYRGSYHLPRPHTGQSQLSPSHSRNGSSSSMSPGRRVSSNTSQSHYSNRYQNSSSPSHPRPNMAPRLDTIHSVVSTPGLGSTEQAAYFAQKQNMLGRQPSRAERSAAKNMEDAKKRGWRSGVKEEKEKKEKSKKKTGKPDGWEVASSAGWTDVTVEGSGKKEKKEGKCVIM